MVAFTYMADKQDCIFLIEGILSSDRWEGEPDKHRVNHKQINYHQDAIDAIYFVMKRFVISQSNALMLLKDFFDHIELDCPLPSQSALSRRKPSTRVTRSNKGRYFVISSTGIQVLKTKPKVTTSQRHALIGYQSKNHISFRIGDNRYRFSNNTTGAGRKKGTAKKLASRSVTKWLNLNRQQIGTLQALLNISGVKLFDALIPFYPTSPDNRQSLEAKYADFILYRNKQAAIKNVSDGYKVDKYVLEAIEVTLLPYNYKPEKESKYVLFIRCLNSNLCFIRYIPDDINTYIKPLRYSISATKEGNLLNFTISVQKNEYKTHIQNYGTSILCSTRKQEKEEKKYATFGSRAVNKALFAESISNNQTITFADKLALTKAPIRINFGNLELDCEEKFRSHMNKWISHVNLHLAEPLMEDIHSFDNAKPDTGFVGEFTKII